MSKNIINDRPERRVANSINQLMRENKQIRTDQTQGNGYFPLVKGTTDPIDAPIGSLYYNTSTNKLRLLKNTGWVDVI